MSGTEVKGARELAATTHAAAQDLRDMETQNRVAGEIVRARAASEAPKVTGALAGSISAQVTATEVVVASSSVYAARVNFGMPSVGQAAQPFMTNALTDTERTLLDGYSRKVNDSISHVRGA